MIAPTGTIGLLMDCDTTGVEPDFALVKFKKLAGGGYFKIINRCVPEALRTLGYGQARDRRHRALCRRPRHARRTRNALSHGALRAKGFGDARDRGGREARWSRPSTSASCSTNGRSARSSAPTRCGSTRAALDAPDFDLLKTLGFSKAEIDAANLHVCGAMTLEGAPHLKDEHLPVFDCANPCGRSASARSRSRATSACWRRASRSSRARSPRPSTCRTTRRVKDCGESYHAVLEARAEGQRALSRRLQAVAAAGLAGAPDRRRRGRDRRPASPQPQTVRTTVVTERIVEKIIERIRAHEREKPAPSPQGLYPEGHRRRPQSVSAHRRIRRRPRWARSSSTCTRKAPPSAA